ALSLDHDNIDIILGYAELFDRAKKPEEAARQYENAGGVHWHKGDDERAFECYRSAHERDRRSRNVALSLFNFLAAKGRRAEADECAREILPTLFQKGELDPAKVICDKMATIDSSNPLFHALLAAIHRKRGETADMNRKLKAAGRLFPRDAQARTKLSLTITALLGDGGDMAHMVAHGAPNRGRRRLIAVAAVALALLLAAGAYAVITEMRQRETIEELGRQAKELEKKGDLKKSLESLKQIEKIRDTMILPPEKSVKEEIVRVETEIGKKEDPVKPPDNSAVGLMEGTMTKARKARNEGNLAMAVQLAKDAGKSAQELGRTDIADAARLLEEEVARYIREAEERFKEAAAFEKEGKIASSIAAMQDVLRLYPHSDAAKRAYYPLRVTTKPPAAKLYYNNVEAGKSPATLHLPIRGPDALKIDRRGDEIVNALIDHKTVGEMFFELKKNYLWRVPVGGMARADAAESDGVLYIPSKNRLYAIQTESGRLAWDFSAGDDLETSPVVSGGVVYVGSNDRKLIAVRGGKRLWESKLDGVVSAGPIFAGNSQTILLGTSEGTFAAVDTKNGDVLSIVNLSSPPSVRPVWRNGTSYLGCANGMVCAVGGVDRKTILWKYTTPGSVTPCALPDDLVIFGCTDRKLYALGREGGLLRWFKELGGEIVAAPVVRGRELIVGCKDSFIYILDIADGRVLRSYKTGGAIQTSPLVVGEKLLTGSDDGSMYCFQADDGSLIWRYECGKPVRSSPCAKGGVVFFGSDDTNVYALEID
ncbi:MAG: hypothetical protein A2Z34_05525, partial [Planctomycetes bacterium RBG_16_59_8]